MPPATCPSVQCVRVAHGGHTFRPVWAQTLVHNLIDHELAQVLRKGSLRGDLVLEQAPLSLGEGRLDIYCRFRPDGKQVRIVGLKEESVKSFRNEAENY